MENTDLLLLAMLGGGIALLLIVAIAKYLADYFADIRYVKMEVYRADDWDEYVYWRRELSALRWSIIPGLTPERVKRIKKAFYRGKYAKKHEKSDGFISMLIPSVLSICICAVCLVGGTFAWFTASQSTGTQVIQSASYTVSVDVKSGEENVTAEDGVFSLADGKDYVLTITPTGDASTGYCILYLGDAELHTKPIPKDTVFTLELDINQPTTLRITPQWGSSIKPDEERIASGTKKAVGEEKQEVIPPPADQPEDSEETTTLPEEDTTPPETKPEEPVAEHTVVSGDSLSSIAKKYGTTVEKLAAYNNIENVNHITIGQVIKLPPADYEIPKETEETEEISTDTTQNAQDGTQPPESTEGDQTPTETTEPAQNETEPPAATEVATEATE